MRASWGIAVVLCVSCGPKPGRTMHMQMGDASQPGQIGRPLAEYLAYAAGPSTSLDGSVLHPAEVIHARYAACADDAQITEFELEVIFNSQLLFWEPDKVLRGEPVEIGGAHARPRSPYRPYDAYPAAEIRVGPCTLDLADADPSLLFGRAEQTAAKPALDLESELTTAAFAPVTHPNDDTPPGGGGETALVSSLRFDAYDLGMVFLYVIDFRAAADADEYASRISTLEAVTDWAAFCGECAPYADKGAEIGFSVVTLHRPGAVRVYLVIAQRTVELSRVATTLGEVVERVDDSLLAHEAASEALSGYAGWPPPMPEGYFDYSTAQMVADAMATEDPARRTMILIIAAQLGDAGAASQLPDRLRAGEGLLAPAPELAAAWEARLAR